jgi:DNA-binding NarL/FixJ family response regulator
MNGRRKWTAEEDDRLLELKAAGKSLSVIAEELNRSQASIDSRTNRLKEMKAALGLMAKRK